MMRAIVLTLILCLPILARCQQLDPPPPEADSGIAEFKEQAKKDTPDYSNALRMLANEVKQHPTKTTLRYFYGYTLDRINANDGEAMLKQTLGLAVETSEQFEAINRLEPTYKGEIFSLDPYSKITSIWGSMALMYLSKNKADSAKWALKEGRKRGGFIDPLLDFNRQLLYSCDPHSILIASGDNITFSCLYLQGTEELRKDISVLDINLLGSTWYPKYVKRQALAKLEYNDAQIDTMAYKEWTTQPITVTDSSDSSRHYSWDLKPTYKNYYLLRGDIMLASIIRADYFGNQRSTIMNSVGQTRVSKNTNTGDAKSTR